MRLLAGFCDGDARSALNALETAYNSQRSNECKPVVIGPDCVKEVMQRTHVQYDRAGMSVRLFCVQYDRAGMSVRLSYVQYDRADRSVRLSYVQYDRAGMPYRSQSVDLATIYLFVYLQGMNTTIVRQPYRSQSAGRVITAPSTG